MAKLKSRRSGASPITAPQYLGMLVLLVLLIFAVTGFSTGLTRQAAYQERMQHAVTVTAVVEAPSNDTYPVSYTYEGVAYRYELSECPGEIGSSIDIPIDAVAPACVLLDEPTGHAHLWLGTVFAGAFAIGLYLLIRRIQRYQASGISQRRAR